MRSLTGLYVTTGIKGKAAFVARRARTNDAGVITDQDGENESRLKRLCSASSAFESIASHYRSSFGDRYFDPFYFFTLGHVAFVDYPRHYAKASKAPPGYTFRELLSLSLLRWHDVGAEIGGLSLSLTLPRKKTASFTMQKIEVSFTYVIHRSTKRNQR